VTVPFNADQPDDLLPLSVVVDTLADVLAELDGVDELLRAHRRACSDDHRELDRLQSVTTRLNQAWTATSLARNRLRQP